jgi:hypothetical protein
MDFAQNHNNDVMDQSSNLGAMLLLATSLGAATKI